MKSPTEAQIWKLENNQDIFGDLDWFADNVANKYAADDERAALMAAALEDSHLAEWAEWLDAATSETTSLLDNWHLLADDNEDDWRHGEIVQAKTKSVYAMLLVSPQILFAADAVEKCGGIVGKRIAVHYRRYEAVYGSVWKNCVEYLDKKTDRTVYARRPFPEFMLVETEIFETQKEAFGYLEFVKEHADESFNGALAGFYGLLGEMRDAVAGTAGKNLLERQYAEARYSRSGLRAWEELSTIRESVDDTDYCTDGLVAVCDAMRIARDRILANDARIAGVAADLFPELVWQDRPMARS